MKRTDIKTILVIGSGPIIIGQAAEFDYAGTQACLSLKEEGYRVILINSNPATIMTDAEIADKSLYRTDFLGIREPDYPKGTPRCSFAYFGRTDRAEYGDRTKKIRDFR